MTTRRTRSIAALVTAATAVIAAAGTAGTGTAQAAPAAPAGPVWPLVNAGSPAASRAGGGPVADPGKSALLANQLVVDRVADRIQTRSPDTATSGLGGITVDPAHRGVTVYWHGDLTAAAQREIAAAAAEAVTVTVRPAPYTQTRLLAQSTALSRHLTDAAGAAPRLVSVGPLPDGSGLDVGISGPPAGTSVTRARTLLPYLDDVTVRLTVHPGDAPEPAWGRLDDSPPFYGGGRIMKNGTGCTAGFGVAGNNGATTYVLTAAHCGQGTWTTGAGKKMGSTIPDLDWAHDAELIRADGFGFMYDSADPADPAPLVRSVHGTAASHVGDGVCTSGSYTGAICGATIVRINESVTVDGHPMILSRAEDAHGHTPMAGNGDSGGPVVNIADGFAFAHGTITAYDGNTVVPCAGVPTASDRKCGWRFWFPDITQQEAAIGFRVLVGSCGLTDLTACASRQPGAAEPAGAAR